MEETEEKKDGKAIGRANLKPFTKGDPRIHRGGRKKGSRNWSTIVKSVLQDEELMDKIAKNKPAYWNSLEQKNAANAIAVAMVIEALKGKRDAAEWLRKTGYGDKLDLTSEEERVSLSPIIISEIKARHGTPSIKAKTETDDSDTE